MTDPVERGTRFTLDELEDQWVAFFDRRGRERIGKVVERVGQQTVRVRPPAGDVVRVERDRLIRYAPGPSAFASPRPAKRAVASVWLNGYGEKRAPKTTGFLPPHITCTCGGDHSAVERDILLPDGRRIPYWACPDVPPLTAETRLRLVRVAGQPAAKP